MLPDRRRPQVAGACLLASVFLAGCQTIEADVDIQGGNSGGALLDGHGNVVGVSYAGIGPPGKFSAGVNFFIPIMDALKKVNIEFAKPGSGA